MANIATPITKPFYVFNGFEAGLKPKEIINMKYYNGQNYFLIKWGKTDDPTYVKKEVANVKCPLLVCEFYQKHTIIKGDTIIHFNVFNGFEAGLKPEEIINMKHYNGQYYFLIKWGETDDPTYVKKEVANVKCPLLVCEFYQTRTIIKGATILFIDNE